MKIKFKIMLLGIHNMGNLELDSQIKKKLKYHRQLIYKYKL